VLYLFATNLRNIRKQKRLTQTDLAVMLNTTKGTISNYETGFSSPSLDVLKELCVKLNVSSDELLDIRLISLTNDLFLDDNIHEFISNNHSLLNKLNKLDKEKLIALEKLLE
jgi:transcriptional regulator with XRE-family HTH domain